MQYGNLKESSRRGTGDKKLSSLWIVSFGDLLTLILCFFLSLISLGHVQSIQTNQDETLTPEKQKPNFKLSDLGELKVPSGISIANIESGKLMFSLRLKEEDYSTGKRPDMAPSLKELEKEMVSVGYVPQEVVVEACSGQLASGNGKDWFESVRRTLALKSQLIDAGINPPKVMLRSVGSSCESIRNETEKKVVAKLVIKATRRVHG